jgi:hypothetical protein
MIQLSKQALLILALILVPSLLVIGIHWGDTGLFFKAVFLAGSTAAVFVGRWLYNRNKNIDLFLDVGVALVAAALIFKIYPGEFFDDAGFVLRYLENFKDGFFYAYNSTDGPVFGISSAFQGLVNGAICATGLWLPEQALRRTAFIGLVVLIFFLIRIVRGNTKSNIEFLIWTGIIIVSSKFFLNVMKAGLETPMHIAVVTGAFWAYYEKRTRLMWFLLALAAISKLDAVPLVVITALFWLIENHKQWWPLRLNSKAVRDILTFAVVPVITWIAAATYFFGSPLPQSAYAKIHYHFHPDDNWFPFFVRYAKDDFYFPVLWITLISSLIMLVFAYVRRHQESLVNMLRNLLPGASFIGTMVLYYFYNPGERMMWYYALPDILLLLQLVLSLSFLLRMIDHVWIRSGTTFVTGFALFLFLFPDVYGGKWWLDEYLNTVEYERATIGRYIEQRVPDHDTVMVWHGLPGRYTKGYVLDMSGLNSKLVTKYERNSAQILKEFRPNYTVNHQFYDYTEVVKHPPYSLDTMFYDITAYGHPSWQIYKRLDGNVKREFPIMMSEPNVWAGESEKTEYVFRVKGPQMTLAFHDDAPLVAFACGIEKQDQPMILHMELFIGDSLIETSEFNVDTRERKHPDEPKKVQALRWNFNNPIAPPTEAHIKYKLSKGDGSFVIVDPAIIQRF